MPAGTWTAGSGFEQELVVAGDVVVAGCADVEVASRLTAQRLDEDGPPFGPYETGGSVVEPVELPATKHEDAAQDELRDPVGMGLGVRERQCAPPRAAEDLPALDAERRTERLDVGDEVPGRVGAQVRCRGGRVRRRAPAPTLVEQDDRGTSPGRRTAHRRAAPSAGTTVQDDDGLAVGAAALLPVQAVAVADVEHARVVRLDRWVQSGPTMSHSPLVGLRQGRRPRWGR
jgi:hypothetical protein